MKKHVLWLALAVAAFAVAAGYMFRKKRAPHAPPSRNLNVTTPTTPRFAPPAANQALPKKPAPEVPIQDGKTIDFSSGLAIVKDSAKEKAIIERSVKEMEAALQNVSFESKPAPPPEDEKKKAEPEKAPPR